MKRWIVALVAGFLLVSCTNSAPSDSQIEPERECLFHGALQENGCLYDAPELARLTGGDNYPVWVYYGIPQKHGDGYLLRVSNEPGAAFMVLDLSTLPETALTHGINSLIGWKTQVVGRYTSSDIADPSVPGASGTLVAVDIGWLRDPDRPQGPYHQLRQ